MGSRKPAESLRIRRRLPKRSGPLPTQAFAKLGRGFGTDRSRRKSKLWRDHVQDARVLQLCDHHAPFRLQQEDTSRK